MSRATRLGLVAVAVVVEAAAFAVLRPSDEGNSGPAEPTDRRAQAAEDASRPALPVLRPGSGPAGGRGRFDFPAEFEGQFEIELEQSREQIGNLVVTP